MARVADELALEEGDVDDGGVEVDELEDEHFERQVVVEVRLCAMHLWTETASCFWYCLVVIPCCYINHYIKHSLWYLPMYLILFCHQQIVKKKGTLQIFSLTPLCESFCHVFIETSHRHNRHQVDLGKWISNLSQIDLSSYSQKEKWDSKFGLIFLDSFQLEFVTAYLWTSTCMASGNFSFLSCNNGHKFSHSETFCTQIPK